MPAPNGHPALVLNADYKPLSYFPLSIISWHDAVKAVVEDTHVVVAEYDTVVRSPSVEMRLPSVLAVRTYVPLPRIAPFTRFNVFLRDRFRCQYCGETFRAHDLTFDHVVPRALGGRTEWANIVAACDACNNRKDSGTQMQPLRAPYQPSVWELQKISMEFPPNYLHESWIDFLYWDSEIEG